MKMANANDINLNKFFNNIAYLGVKYISYFVE